LKGASIEGLPRVLGTNKATWNSEGRLIKSKVVVMLLEFLELLEMSRAAVITGISQDVQLLYPSARRTAV
jgi:hypothetical protein